MQTPGDSGLKGGLALPLLPLLLHVGKRVRAEFQRCLSASGIPRGQGEVLLMLREGDGIAQSQLAVRLEVSAPTLTNTLHRMEAREWIRRERDPHDERCQRVSLTAVGARAAEDAWRALLEVETRMVAGMEPEQILWLHRGLRAARALLGGQGPADEAPLPTRAGGEQVRTDRKGTDS